MGVDQDYSSMNEDYSDIPELLILALSVLFWSHKCFSPQVWKMGGVRWGEERNQRDSATGRVGRGGAEDESRGN